MAKNATGRLSILQNLYRAMIRIRLAEELLAEKVLAKEIGTPCHLYVGQEAIAAGISEALQKRDFVFGTHRSHGHYLAKGGDINKLFAEIYGKATGCSKGRGGSMHLTAPEVGFMGSQPIVAGTIPIAVGAALASSIKKDKRVTVAFFGDGAVEEGVFHEALNFAALHKLPIIFVCENNLYSSHPRIDERRAKNNIFEEALIHGMESSQMDGQNAVELYEYTKRVLPGVRKGNPIFIEALTYRFRGHVGAIDSVSDQHVQDIRNLKEIEQWKKRDPLVIFKQTRLLSKDAMQKIESQEKKLVAKAYQFAIRSPYPDTDTLTEYTFK